MATDQSIDRATRTKSKQKPARPSESGDRAGKHLSPITNRRLWLVRVAHQNVATNEIGCVSGPRDQQVQRRTAEQMVANVVVHDRVEGNVGTSTCTNGVDARAEGA